MACRTTWRGLASSAQSFRVYGRPYLTSLLTDTEGGGRVVSVLMRVAPKMLQLEEAGDLDFRNDLVAAAIEIYEARAGGARMSLRELADQRPLGRTPETQAFLDYFAANPTKENEPVRIFNELADWATANHYDPTGMFADESPVATRVDLMAEFADLAGVEVDPTVLAQIGATVSREQTIEKVRTRISEQLAETGMDADQVDAQATLWTGAVMRLAAQNEVEPLDILPKIKLDGVVGQSDSFSQVVKVYHDQNLSVGDQVEFARTLREWTSEETLSRARGRSREQIFEEFDNTLTPIAFIPEDFLPHIFVNKLSDDRVYSSQAYFVDHEVNHHGQDILPSDYFRIQEILSEPEEVILDRRKGEDKAIFTKQYGRNFLVVVKIELGADGHLQMYKTLHKTRKKKPYPTLDRAPLPVYAHRSKAGVSQFVRIEEPRYTPGGDNFSGRDSQEDIVAQRVEEVNGRELRGAFSPSQNRITLTPNANITTFSHEMGHWWLANAVELSKRADVNPELRRDVRKLFDLWGVKDQAD